MRKNVAFTLIELLVVVAIISLLVSILLPSLQTAKQLAMKTVCMSRLRNIGAMMNFYAEDNSGSLPCVEEGWTYFCMIQRPLRLVFPTGGWPPTDQYTGMDYVKSIQEQLHCPSTPEGAYITYGGDIRTQITYESPYYSLDDRDWIANPVMTLSDENKPIVRECGAWHDNNDDLMTHLWLDMHVEFKSQTDFPKCR